MKFFAFAVLFSVSLSQAATLNGVTLSNVPTASKSYQKEVLSNETVVDAAAKMQAECSKDMADTLADLEKKQLRIVKKTDCKVSIHELNGCDQGGCNIGTFLSANFEILFL